MDIHLFYYYKNIKLAYDGPRAANPKGKIILDSNE
jgi:hypothetical protein